jgi:hypothetical protein
VPFFLDMFNIVTGSLLALDSNFDRGRCLSHVGTEGIDTSGLVERKALEAFDWDFQPSLDKSLVLELARLDFVRRHDDLVITGHNGTGKSHILKAFALRACEQGIHMRNSQHREHRNRGIMNAETAGW